MAKQNKFYLRLAAFVAAVVILLAAGPFYILNIPFKKIAWQGKRRNGQNAFGLSV